MKKTQSGQGPLVFCRTNPSLTAPLPGRKVHVQLAAFFDTFWCMLLLIWAFQTIMNQFDENLQRPTVVLVIFRLRLHTGVLVELFLKWIPYLTSFKPPCLFHTLSKVPTRSSSPSTSEPKPFWKHPVCSANSEASNYLLSLFWGIYCPALYTCQQLRQLMAGNSNSWGSGGKTPGWGGTSPYPPPLWAQLQ